MIAEDVKHWADSINDGIGGYTLSSTAAFLDYDDKKQLWNLLPDMVVDMLSEPSPRRREPHTLAEVDPVVLMRAARRLAGQTGSDEERTELLMLALHPPERRFYTAPLSQAERERLLAVACGE